MILGVGITIGFKQFSKRLTKGLLRWERPNSLYLVCRLLSLQALDQEIQKCPILRPLFSPVCFWGHPTVSIRVKIIPCQILYFMPLSVLGELSFMGSNFCGSEMNRTGDPGRPSRPNFQRSGQGRRVEGQCRRPMCHRYARKARVTARQDPI